MMHGYLRVEVPLYAYDEKKKTSWTHLASQQGVLQQHEDQIPSEEPSTTWLVDSKHTPIDFFDYGVSTRIDSIHSQLGDQNTKVQQDLARYAFFTRAGFN